MNDNTIQDLKQFIAHTVSQATAGLATKEDIARLEKNIARVEKKVDDGFAGIGDSVSDINDQLSDHASRLTNLETSKA